MPAHHEAATFGHAAEILVVEHLEGEAPDDLGQAPFKQVLLAQQFRPRMPRAQRNGADLPVR